MTTVRVEILVTPDCRVVEALTERIAALVRQLAIDVEMRTTYVRSQRTAILRGMAGSPSVRINGFDIEHSTLEMGSLDLRLYSGEAIPSCELISKALERAWRDSTKRF